MAWTGGRKRVGRIAAATLLGVSVLAGGALAAGKEAQVLNGAGATFPQPLYMKWTQIFGNQYGIRVNYQGIGSGGGQKQIMAKTVDFAGSDAPMSDEQLQQAPAELVHVPTALGAVVVTYNVPGVTGSLKMTPDVVADIFLGKITKWNDARLTALNPGVSLPDKEIIVVHRSDGSGTTYVFTDYLSKVSPEWKDKVGMGTSVKWPAGLGGKGNDGVAGLVKQTSGSIGYVELIYAEQNKLEVALLKNRAGVFVRPTLASTSAAAAGAVDDMRKDVRVSIVDAPGKDSYPIASFTYLLFYKNALDEATGRSLAKFAWWAIHDGQKYNADLLYAPLPKEAVAVAEDIVRSLNYNGTPFIAAPAAANTVKVTVGKKQISVRGQSREIDAAPVVRNGRVLIPVRFVSEALGGQVKWDGKAHVVIVTLGADRIEVPVGKAQAKKNGRTVTLDAAAENRGGRVYVPVRFVSEALGWNVNWDDRTKTVTISR